MEPCGTYVSELLEPLMESFDYTFCIFKQFGVHCPFREDLRKCLIHCTGSQIGACLLTGGGKGHGSGRDRQMIALQRHLLNQVFWLVVEWLTRAYLQGTPCLTVGCLQSFVKNLNILFLTKLDVSAAFPMSQASCSCDEYLFGRIRAQKELQILKLWAEKGCWPAAGGRQMEACPASA